MKPTYYSEKILEQLPFGVLFFSNKQVIFANTAAENILGVSRDKIKKCFNDLKFSKKIIDFFLKAQKEAKIAKIYEESFVNYLGKNFLLNFYFIPLQSKDDEMIVILEDCSFLKTIESTRYDHAHVEKLALLFACMAHEIKNPLGVIKGTLQLIKKDKGFDGESEALDIIFSELARIESIVQSLLDYSAPQKVNIEKFNILSLLQKIIVALNPIILEKKIAIINEVDTTFPEIVGDKESLYKAFFNIIKNAVEACFLGGKVGIKVRAVLDRKYRKNDRNYNYLVIEISDTGAGIPEEDLKFLFTPFYTTKYRGTGLGMVYAQKVIFDHSGFIQVESKKNVGTKVSVFLPMKE